jgi:chromosome segregation ATPase
MLIREVILENFMSYEYARVPFESGVNVICGPNGAGKSSILLGISIAFGQSTTERSRKLSDLIRWGKDQARVTIVLDNSSKSGKRPVRRLNKDRIYLTRVLRRDGKYWFELDNRAATKKDVERLLAKFGVDPDNLLIIMHQNMTELFAVFSPEQRLKAVEAAVGLEPYRRHVLQAKRKLSRILSEEESVGRLLDTAAQTLNYWREQHDRYQQKKQLHIKRRFLERELAWTKATKIQSLKERLESQIQVEDHNLEKIANQTRESQATLAALDSELREAKLHWRRLLQEQSLIACEKTRNETLASLKTEYFDAMDQLVETSLQRLTHCLTLIQQLEPPITIPPDQSTYVQSLSEIKGLYKELESSWAQQLAQRNEGLRNLVETSNGQIEKTRRNLLETEQEAHLAAEKIDDTTDQLINLKIETALLDYKKQTAEKTLKKLRKELQAKTFDYNEAVRTAEQTGSRIASARSPDDILDEIRLTDGHLTALADVSEDIERMYESYSTLYLNLKEKAQTVEENRQKTMAGITTRMEDWRRVIKNLLEKVSLRYQEILSKGNARGEVHLAGEDDIETAGLEVLVGFKGAPPVPLDAYTQSGGERSLATMSFLLALQHHVQSPFRAVDEYDVHMDPKNRETITQLLVESVQNQASQYLIITPSRLTLAEEAVHLITVQNIEGTSRAREAV